MDKIKKVQRQIVSLLVLIGLIMALSAPFSAQSYMRGDANLDGKVSTSDVRTILSYIAGLTQLSALGKVCADYNGDGNIDTTDARLCMLSAISNDSIIEPSAGEEVRATWVGTNSGDFPSSDNLSAAKLKAEIDTIVTTCSENGINTIFFQVRAFSDAMYASSIFPASTVLVENQGDSAPLDCLEYFVSAAHAKGIALHAWINPYRISSKSHSTSALARTNPAVLHPEWVVKHYDEGGNEAGLWYNPALPEVRQLIIDGVNEIINNYSVDGIHIDDYFYPYSNASGFEDGAAYEKYGNGMSLADWRRDNVNQLVSGIHTTVKAKNSYLKFGVSPFGVWAKKTSSMPDGVDGIGWTLESYSDIYADSRSWVTNGYVDYVCPQVYWEMSNAKAPFKPIVDWWNDLCEKYDTELYIGIAAYKGETGSSPFAQPAEIISQLEYLTTKSSVTGASIFAYHNIANNTAGISDTLKTVYSKYINGYEKPPFPVIPSTEQAYEINTDGAELMLQTGNSDEYGPTEHCCGIKGMRETVSEFVTREDEYGDSVKYAKLSNGYYIEASQLSLVANETYGKTILLSSYFKPNGKYSDLVFECNQNVSNTVWLDDNEAVVTLYGLYNADDAVAPDVTAVSKLFTSARVEKVDETTVRYHFTYNSKYFIFGFTGSYNNGKLSISFKNPVALSSNQSQPLAGIKISLDPGHSTKGGAERVYNGTRYYEYAWNLELAQKVKSRLEALGATVRLSHDGEWQKPLSTLIPEIIAWEPDINVSIHFNDASSSSANGNSSFWCFRNSALLAKTMVKTFVDETGLNMRSEGVDGAPMGYYMVSRFCNFPSVLFETLFMSNDKDMAWYVQPSNRDVAAQAITDGIYKYFELQS